MRYLLFLIKRSRIFLLFLLLEGLALALVVNRRSFQRFVFADTLQSGSSYILDLTSGMDNYFHLREENQALARQNSRLHDLLERSMNFQSLSGGDTIQDSIYQQRFQAIPAEVIYSSHSKRNNYLTIDKGRQSGIEPGMGVMGANGVVGVVREVSQHFAGVIPIINPNLTISGKLKESGYFGSLQWDPSLGHKTLVLRDIPRYAKIDSGSSVITDSRSLIFPEGIPVGTTQSKKIQKDQNFYEVRVAMDIDFAKLEHVYVIKDKFAREIDSLQP